MHALVVLSFAVGVACGAHGGAPAGSAVARDGAEGGGAIQDADIRFMRDMIVHHGQALDMTALVPEQAAGDDVKRLALRIEAAQKDEIARMRRWLSAKGVPGPDAHAQHGGHAMQGMLTDDEMTRLADARGEAFDALFVASMIRHHEGALAMVAELFAGGGATRDIEVFQLASQIDADQRAEIARLRTMRSPGR